MQKRHIKLTKFRLWRRFCQRWIYYAAAAAFLLANLQFSQPANAVTSDCNDVEFVFARGSGEKLGDVSHRAWKDAIGKNMRNSGLRYGFYELGSGPQGGYQYPAVSVSDTFGGYVNLVGAYVSSGSSFEFGRSVNQGVGELKAYLASVSRLCPSTKFVLGGYSQGAMVLTKTLPELDANKILYVATFGDPKLYLPEGESKVLGLVPKIPDACRGENLSPYRVDVVDCYAYEGVLGSYRPYQPSGYLGKLGAWCNGKDIMCSSGLSVDDHTSYVSSNYYYDAADVIYTKLVSHFGNKIGAAKPANRQLREVVFVFDETLSMYPYIKDYSAEAKRLAKTVIDEGGHIALVSYGDLAQRGAKLLCNFSCTFEEFSTAIDTLRPMGGGDIPESLFSAALFALNSVNWTNGATKSMVVLTDASYLTPDRDGTTFNDVVKRSFEIDPVNIYPITPTAMSEYDELAQATNGQSFTLDDQIILSETILTRPTARLALSEYSGAPGDTFTFDASRSDGDETLTFDWDLDGDNIFELTNQPAILQKTYETPQDCYIQVRVTNSAGKSSTMSAHLVVSNESSTKLATISNLVATPAPNGRAKISFVTDATAVLLSVNEAVLGLVETTPGANNFTLGDLESEADITLTPFSTTGRRGISLSTKAVPGPYNPTPNPDISEDFTALPPLTSLKVPNTGHYNAN